MFETLNARGAEASKIDILKNYLFDLAQNRISDIHLSWVGMISTIEGFGDDDLLIKYVRHYWISHNGPTTQSKLGESIERFVKSERQAVDIVLALRSSAEDYVALLNPLDHPRWSNYKRTTREAIHTVIHDLGGEQIRPLMLSVAKRFPKDEADKVFQLMVSWSVRFLIVGGGGGGLLDRYYGVRAKEISNGNITDAKALRKSMLDVVPNDEQFRRAFAHANVSRTHLARYYLRAMELYSADERHPQLIPSEDTSAVNLEHVLPINPSKEWNIDPEVASAFYKRIGNLVLLGATQNVALGNKTYGEKRRIMQKSPFVLTSQAAENKDWRPEEIEARQAKLANLAPKVWPN